jgi:acyl-homoserine-lactone acylase
MDKTTKNTVARTLSRILQATLVGSFALSLVPTTAYSQQSDESRSPKGAVQIYRDSYGLPHLYAQREEDGFYGLGYALAEDRLQQVLTLYLAVRGELAATFGVAGPPVVVNGPFTPGDTVALDRISLKYQYLSAARRNFSKLPRQYQKNLRAYIRGIERYMRDHPEKTPQWAPKLEPALPLALFHFFVQEQESGCTMRRKADQAAPSSKLNDLDRVSTSSPLAASNAWALAGSRTADGRVLFSSDSHGPIELYGTLFYSYRIHAGALDFFAADPAGTAMFLFGHSRHFAWGVTEGPRFVTDCYRIRVNSDAPDTFNYDGNVKRIKTVPYSIRVQGAAPVTGTFEYIELNGMLSPIDSREGDTAYAVSFAYTDRIGLGAGQYYRMAKARNRSELETALEQRDIYPANLIIGGADGTIMFIRPGRVPRRPAGVDVRRTIDGNTAATAWLGMHSYADLPKIINPPQGFVGNTNASPDMMYPNSPLRSADYPDYFAFEPGRTNSRQQRLIELLEGAERATLDDAKAIAMDETIQIGRAAGSAISRLHLDLPELISAQPSEIRDFLSELARFDGRLAKDSRGALYFAELTRALAQKNRSDLSSLVKQINSGIALEKSHLDTLIAGAVQAREQLIAAHGTGELTWGNVHRVGRNGVDLPVGGGSVPEVGAASLRALTFANDPSTHKRRLVGGQRVPFVVHFAADGVQSYAQFLNGINDDSSSRHHSDQAQLASDKTLRMIPLTPAALSREQATRTVIKTH